MNSRFLHHAAFTVGLAVVAWVGAGYVGTHPLALAITVLVAGFYLMGALELHRYHQATAGLQQALAGLGDTPPAALGPWLAGLPPSLQPAVRLRVEGERVGLPGPALTPYLAGLLVLLGMLGTFLGMVVTLRGTGLALDSAADLAAVRASLSAPVKGLGLAFGTSVAGVAASAMLGLMSALARRERQLAAQALDARAATTLRVFSQAHQREESFKLLQQQVQAMPQLVGSLQAAMTALQQQGQAMNEQLLARQQAFDEQAGARTQALAASVEQSLKDSLATSLTESARLASATLQPAVESTLAGLAREASGLHGALAQALQQQADMLAARFEATTATAAAHLEAATKATAQQLETTTAATAAHLQASTAASAAHLESSRAAAEAHFEASTAASAAHFEASTAASTAQWQAALAEHQQASTALAATLQAQLAEADAKRLAAFDAALQGMAATLQQQWQQAGAATLAQQQQICDTLASTARGMSADAQAHAQATIAEIGRLVQAAAEAPRAAAEVVAELRQKLSDSMVRDNAMLDERNRLLQTLGGLLDAVNHASTEQRSAIDALVARSAQLLGDVGQRFAERVDAQTAQLADTAAQVGSGAIEVASLGEAFGQAVARFGEGNDKLLAQLGRIEAALSQSLARSDEQLAYYVAQAREVIDLSISSQQQIVDELQQLAGNGKLAVVAEDA